jgi:hypothetical protein
VLRVSEAQASEVIPGERSPLSGHVELDEHLPGLVDVEDFAAGAVLDALHSGLVVLVDHGYAVACANAVVNTGHLDFKLAELPAL